jgi:hypothetical protein
VPVIFCKAGERKHRIAEAYLATREVGTGVFLVLVAKAPATVWKVARAAKTGAIVNIERRREYVNYYSFHIIDPEWGHITMKMSGLGRSARRSSSTATSALDRRPRFLCAVRRRLVRRIRAEQASRRRSRRPPHRCRLLCA